MTRSHAPRLARPVVAVYWLMILGGLLLFSAGRIDHAGRLTPLWLGAIAGTALGQFLAFRNLRLWLTLLLLIALAYFSMPLMTAGVDPIALWKVLVPAVLCGYWSLGDRAIATAFWFPAVLWMLSILDRTSGDARAQGQLVPDATGVALLIALALAFFLFLRVRESRRVGLWSTIAARPLAPSRSVSTLRQPPAQQVLRAGWSVAVTASTALITAWIAPRLWQIEALRGAQARVADDTTALGLPCCPASRVAEMKQARISEYLDLGLGHDQGMLPGDERGPACAVCAVEAAAAACDGCKLAAVEALHAYGAGVGEGEPAADNAGVVTVEPFAPEATPTIVAVEAMPGVPIELAPATRPTQAPPAPLLPAHDATPPIVQPPAPPPAVAQTPAPATTVAHAHDASPGSVRRAAPPPPALWPWLALIAIAALVMQVVTLGLRPLRRLVLLRHLRDPLWPETIDQRVSNAWQLALIGLGDAGWRPESGEAPRELAARAGVDGVERCAVILERARHGLGLDAGDLSEMRTSAITAYASARAGLGPTGRALSWLRWPLTR